MAIVAENYDFLRDPPQELTWDVLMGLPYYNRGPGQFLVWRDGCTILFVPTRHLGSFYMEKIAGHVQDSRYSGWVPTPIGSASNFGCTLGGEYTDPPFRFDRQFIHYWGLPRGVESMGQFIRYFEKHPEPSPEGPWSTIHQGGNDGSSD